MKSIYSKKFNEKRDYFFYFLLFFVPLINFIINNLFFFELNYFLFCSILFISLYCFILIVIFLLSILKIRVEKPILFFFLIWYFQFYFRDIYNFFNLDLGGDQVQKYTIVISLIIISFLILYLNRIKKFNLFFKTFLVILLFLNLISNFNISSSSWKYKANNELFSTMNSKSHSIDKKNIYFFLMDEMTSAKVYRELGLNLDSYISEFKKLGYNYFYNSYSNYNGSQITIGSIFNIDYYPTNTKIKEEYFYPYNLFNEEKPLLLKILKNLNYKFWYLDNQYMKCKNINVINCIDEYDKNFFNKILFDEALNIFFYKSFLNKFFYKYKFNTMNKIFRNTEIDYFKKFIKSNDDIISNKNNFFFIHQMNPHYPFRNSNCDVLDNPYIVSVENYLSSTDCALKKINEIINILEVIDNDAIVIFQGDHGFSRFSENNPKDLKSFEVFNLVKVGPNCNLIQDDSIGNIEQFRLILGCSFGIKYTNRISKRYYVKKRLKKEGTVLDEIN